MTARNDLKTAATSLDRIRIRRAYETARDDLLAERNAAGYWRGELSASALSTATATSALAIVMRELPEQAARLEPLVRGGIAYLRRAQNADGGWGDTDKSRSNIATTMLARAAIHLAGAAGEHAAALERAEAYIAAAGGVAGLRRRYGRDKTFAVPILANCALAGLVEWREVAALPFELACFPQWALRFLRLPVVSYAIPALVAIGQARYLERPPLNPILRMMRRRAIEPSLAVLERMQSASGGYLEAAPLTSFVAMSLAGTARAAHPVVQRAVEFLVNSVRADGSWPIDTDLATWGTTLAVGALGAAGEDHYEQGCLDWLLGCQHLEEHPFTGAAPGGWAWTDLSGGVPDADDTPGALLTLAAFARSAPAERRAEIERAAGRGVRWLLGLQNRDGGWPTFCRGWGRLPFDRSGVDLTAHVLRGLAAWERMLPAGGRAARERGLAFLARSQRADGSFVPLWFGNQLQPDEENPVYGTGRVLLAYRELGLSDTPAARAAARWLLAAQNADGGWGGSSRAGESSVEETAVALEALVEGDTIGLGQVERGLGWLTAAVEAGRHREASPIGLYFARLWYYERLYPLVFTVAALGRACRRLESGNWVEASSSTRVP